MNAALGRQDQLLGALLELAHGDVALPCDCFRAVNSHMLKSVDVDGAALIVPIQGTKRVRERADWLNCPTGQALLIPNARSLDVENIADAQSGQYVALAIPLGERVIQAARHLLTDWQAPDAGAVAAVPLAELIDPLSRWHEALRAGRYALACHAMTGVVLSLYEMGHHGVLQMAAPTLTAQIRAMVAADPGRVWASADIEAAFAMSGATLRRRLAAEGASLREVVADARLARALQWLMTTRLPVKTVAARVGYASVSSFIKRFGERYGVEPSRVGSTPR